MTELKKSSDGRVEFWHEGKSYEPQDLIGGRSAASYVVDIASPRNADQEFKILAWYFLLRWEEGPQIARPRGIRGRTPKGDMVPVTFSLERRYCELVPSKGKSEWLRNAAIERLQKEGKIKP